MNTELSYKDYILIAQALGAAMFRGSEAMNVVNLQQKIYAIIQQKERETLPAGSYVEETKEEPVEETQETEPLQSNE